MENEPGGGLKIARLLMVLASIAPLFILWGIRAPEGEWREWVYVTCFAAVVAPNALVLFRVRKARSSVDRQEINVGDAHDERDHVLVYLFSMLSPFFAADLKQPREMLAACFAVFLIVLIFWHLDMHHMNIFLVLLGYRVFSVHNPKGASAASGKGHKVVITKRRCLESGDTLMCWRISDSVFLEETL
jgi:hypothetical protein